MNKFTIIFLIILSSISSLHGRSINDQLTLLECYDDFVEFAGKAATIEDRKNTVEAKYNGANRDCVKENINLSKNANKIDRRIGWFCNLMITTSFFLCVAEPDQLMKLYIEQGMNSMVSDDVSLADCFKNELKKIEPNATIISDFNSATYKKPKEECDAEINFFDEDSEASFTKLYLKDISCGSITLNDVKRFNYRLPILKHAIKDETVKNAEIKFMIKIAMETMRNVNACLIGKM